MPAIRDRGDGNQKRRERLAKIKKGPGVFVYLGKALDHECTPTALKVGKNVPVLDESGMPVLDDAKRPVYEKAGTVVRDSLTGRPVLGGPPKVRTTPMEVFELWGVSFPAGDPVTVSNDALAIKLRGMDSFEEVEEPAERPFASIAPASTPPPPRKKPGPKPKSQPPTAT